MTRKYRRLLSICILLAACTQLRAQGLVFDDEMYRNSPRKAQLLRGDYHFLPDSVSLKPYSPGPGNQLGYATSVGWALAWGARTILYAKEAETTSVAEIRKHIFSPSYVYQSAKNSPDPECSRGITLEAGLDVLKNRGVPGIYTFLDFCGGQITEEIDALAAPHKITGYSKLFEADGDAQSKIFSVKKAIAEGLPVVIGMIAPPSLERAREFWQPTEHADKSYGGQALLVVGYDDDVYGGSFEVLNSWGKGWGNDGYIWIRYTDFVQFVRYGYELFVIPQEDGQDLTGKVHLKFLSGNEMSVSLVGDGYYKMKTALPSGVNFRIYISNEEPAFVYAFGSDLSNKCFPIFPHRDHISAALTYSSNHIAIPDEDHYIQLDNNPGTDYLCVLYTKEELDLNTILKKIESSSGDFRQKVKTALGKDLLNHATRWEQDAISFSAQVDKGSTVMTIVEITHY